MRTGVGTPAMVTVRSRSRRMSPGAAAARVAASGAAKKAWFSAEVGRDGRADDPTAALDAGPGMIGAAGAP
ncbi:hypothetical protein CXF29_10840, partial [Corynebacterium bovis]|uniref:hypothetical protein n=1 Tax=Corynebacterium bovis TaxID=36808 RepID=UPI000FAE8680